MKSNREILLKAGRGIPWILLGIIVLAALGWVALAIWGDTRRAWGILIVDFLFLSSLSAGLVVWPAIILVSRGTWLGSTQRTALAGIALLPFCLLLLIVMFIGVRAWAPWYGHELANSWWLNTPFLVTRDLLSLVFFGLLALWFVSAMNRGKRPKRLAAWLIFAYCIVFSILGFDLAMALDPHWYSALFGAYFFISGLYLAVAGWTLATVLVDRSATPDQLADQSALIITFSMLTAYMMFSQLIVIWYENMPEETRFLAPRMNWVTNWPAISIVLLAIVYLGPLALLLPHRARRAGTYVGIISGLVLATMWIERWWLVMPSLDRPLWLGLSEIVGLVLLLSAGALFLYWVRQRVLPQETQPAVASGQAK
ncbi:MAG: hypothetical protein ABFE01_05035 [Phycisphaerales bacterium]|jgi:hypothetical protein